MSVIDPKGRYIGARNVRFTSPPPHSMPDCTKPGAPISSDGGSTSYYELPQGATELNDLIEHKAMSFALGNIFKACYRFGEKDAASRMYDLNKIIYFAERLKKVEERRAA
ncbi:hypothetical protein FHS76_000543 [Ochrobactrum daejeonense]|uniref:Protein of unknwon function (DUF3310) n=1 Tax=Brucella daejeonensis TaxID=659015 RepID=A0A7W9AU93_9HYPH|nr:hypothetical protein [Brucella daejeonensis]MBB5700700.1 hypothetical protein [Brucella daejeonensis]